MDENVRNFAENYIAVNRQWNNADAARNAAQAQYDSTNTARTQAYQSLHAATVKVTNNTIIYTDGDVALVKVNGAIYVCKDASR